jgi:hypothetical protein
MSSAVNAEGAAWLFCGIGQLLDLFNLVGVDEQVQHTHVEQTMAAFTRAVFPQTR